MRISARCPRFLVGALVAVAWLAQSLPVAAAPAPLPEWDVKKKPAPLPDWDAATKKPEPGKGKKHKGKKPAATPEPVAEPTPEPTPEPAPEPTPEPVVAPPPEPAAPPEPPPPVVTTPPEPAPAAPSPRELEQHKQAERRARGEVITGGVLMGVGVAGLGAMTAGVLAKANAKADKLDRANTIVAAGAIAGISGLVLGVALLVDGLRDRKATRSASTARVRVAPTLGGLVLSGRF